MKTETKPKPKVPKIPAAPDSRAPALAVEAWPVDRPKPYERNPRRNDAAVEKVAASIREFGWAQPIVVDGDGVIIIGHTRLKAAKKLGLKTVPVLVRADLSPEQVAALRLADNKTAELAEWDEPLLAAELDALVGAVDMEQFGFDLSAPELTEGQTDEDAVPEPPPKPVSRRGAVYALGRHRLMCGDSTSAEDVARLLGGAKADLLLTDPPYGIKRDKGFGGACAFGGGTGNKIKRRTYTDEWDAETPSAEAFALALSSAESSIVFGGNFFTDKLPVNAFWIVWDKHNSMPTFGDCELAWTNIKRNSVKKYDCLYNGLVGKEKERFHPTQKPVKIMEEIMCDFSGEGGSVLDLFLGSGTTLVACEKTGRVCYGMELDPHYCDVIRKRWAEFVHGEGCDWQTLAPEVDE